MDNLSIYEKVRSVPQNAQRTIGAGRLKGKTDINPMWRIKSLTEQFGPVGIGWKYTIDRQWMETGSGGEIAAFCNISLYIKVDGQWGDGIPGTGGSAFVASERNGLYTSDECYKMALTDAISVACKALGFGANVYWEADRSKYDKPQQSDKAGSGEEPDAPPICLRCGRDIVPVRFKGKLYSAREIAENAENTYGEVMCWTCMADAKADGK